MARSLEETEHVRPYIEHILSEYERLKKLHRDVRGEELDYPLPQQLDETNLSRVFAGWDQMPVEFRLPQMAAKSGRLIHLAIDGDDGKGTSVVTLLNLHQNRPGGFSVLKPDLIRLSKSGESFIFAANERELSDTERQQYQALIEKGRFTKADFEMIETFYEGPYERLTEFGKSLVSQRTWAGQRGEDVKRTDGEKYAKEIREMYESIFQQLKEMDREDAARWIDWVLRLMGDLTEVELDLAGIERNLLEDG